MPYLTKRSPYYYVDIRVGDLKPLNKSTRTTDLKKATALEQKWRAEREQQWFNKQMGITEPEKTPADVLLSEALKFVWKKRWQHNRCGVKPRTQIEEIINLLGDLPIQAFLGIPGVELMDELQDKLLADGNGKLKFANKTRSKATVDRYMAALRTLLKAIVKRYWPGQPLPDIPMFKVDNARTRLLYPHEEVKLFRLMDAGHPDYSDLCKVLLDTGMRVGELINANYHYHILLPRREILLTADITKNAQVRTVPLTKRAFSILQNRQMANPVKPFDIKVSRVSQVFKIYRKAMGLIYDEEFVPHMLRHTCCTRLLEAGVDWGLVQGWMGHSTSEMTRRYAHLIGTVYRPAAQKLDELQDYIKERDRGDDHVIDMDDFILRRSKKVPVELPVEPVQNDPNSRDTYRLRDVSHRWEVGSS